MVPLATDYPFLGILWTSLVIFAWVIWFWLLITVFADLFRRRDMSGWIKVLWMIFVIVFPYIGVFIYLIANSSSMSERAERQAIAAQQQLDDHIVAVAGSGGAAADIEKAQQLLDRGAITPQEYDLLKRRALA